MTNQKNSLQSAKTSKSKSFRTVRILLSCHHFKAAVFVASCVVILHHCRLLDGLDIATFQLAQPQLKFLVPLKSLGEPRSESDSIKVVTINDKLYETRFKQTSPLDRCELYCIFKKILENKPKVLAVDLDLSPGPEEITVEETELYNLLKQNNNTEIVLITPVKVYSDDLIAKKAQWMEEMCKKEHIRFGLPYLHSVKGMVLKHLSDPRSFASQIDQATNKSGKSDSSNKRIYCKKDNHLNCFNCFVNTKVSTDESLKTKKLNYKFPYYIERIRVENIDNTNKLKEHVVLFGGSYGSTDKYETPVGTLAGVFIHAASYYSVANPVDEYHVMNYFIEIGVSTLLGAVFCLFARWYLNTRSLHSIVFNLIFQLILMNVFILFASIFLRFNLWIHPVALIIGMGIHALYETCKAVNKAIKKAPPCANEQLCILDRRIERVSDYGIAIIEWLPHVKYDSLQKIIKRCLYCAIVIGSWVCIAVEFFEH